MEKIIKIKTPLIDIQIGDTVEGIDGTVNKIQKVSDLYVISSTADSNPSHKCMVIVSAEAILYYSYE